MKLEPSLNWLLALVPVAVALEATHAPALIIAVVALKAGLLQMVLGLGFLLGRHRAPR